MRISNVEAFAISKKGDYRDEHEDNLFIYPNKIITPEIHGQLVCGKLNEVILEGHSDNSSFAAAVSDGMGGCNAGEIISYMTVMILQKIVDSSIQGLHKDAESTLDSMVNAINRKVCAEIDKKPEWKNGGATLAGIITDENAAYSFNVGDSRIYELEHDGMRQLTVDQTEGERLKHYKLLTEKSIARCRTKDSLIEYIGKSENNGKIDVEKKKLNLHQGKNLYLICSDGVVEMIEHTSLYQNGIDDHTGIDNIAKQLINEIDEIAVKESIITDNLTIIVVNVECE